MNERTWDIVILLATAVAGLGGAYFAFKYFKKSIRKFSNRIDDENSVTDFISFIHNLKDDEIFGLDISLDQVYADQFMEEHTISFPEYHNNNLIGGTRINFQKDDEMHIDMRPSSNRIRGNFKITYSAGPQQGWFTASLKFVKPESIYNNL